MSGFDIHIEGVPPGQTTGGKFLTFGSYGRVLGVKGIQKLVDRFLKCLMTPLGSGISDPNYGTILAGSFLGNVDAGALFTIATQAVATAEQTIRQYDSDAGMPDDERLMAAEILDLSVDSTGLGVTLTLLLSNVAGTTVQTQVSSYQKAP